MPWLSRAGKLTVLLLGKSFDMSATASQVIMFSSSSFGPKSRSIKVYYADSHALVLKWRTGHAWCTHVQGWGWYSMGRVSEAFTSLRASIWVAHCRGTSIVARVVTAFVRLATP